MKKLLIFFVGLFCLQANTFASGIVTDPLSYVYYVEQIAKMETQIESGLKTLEKAEVSADKLTAMKKQLEGTYNRIAGLKERMQGRIDRLAKVPGVLALQADSITGELAKNNGYLPDTHNMDEWEKVGVDIDKIFCDPRDPSCNEWLAADLRYETRQEVLKTSLKRSTIMLAGLKKRMKELDALSQEVGKGTQRDEMNLTNRMLAESLVGQQQIIALLAQLAQAQAITRYQGKTIKGTEASANETNKNTTNFEDLTSKIGGRNIRTIDELRKKLGE